MLRFDLSARPLLGVGGSCSLELFDCQGLTARGGIRPARPHSRFVDPSPTDLVCPMSDPPVAQVSRCMTSGEPAG